MRALPGGCFPKDQRDRNIMNQKINRLKNNQYVSAVGRGRVYYTDEFKNLFIKKYKEGIRPTEIFRSAGFDVEILGEKRIERASANWRHKYGIKLYENEQKNAAVENAD